MKERWYDRLSRFITRKILRNSTTRPLNLLSSIASIAALLLLIINEFNFDAAFIPLGYVCLLSFFLLLRYLRQERWARYGEATAILARAYASLQMASEYVPGATSSDQCGPGEEPTPRGQPDEENGNQQTGQPEGSAVAVRRPAVSGKSTTSLNPALAGHLHDALTAFGEAFTLIVGASCRVCLANLFAESDVPTGGNPK